MNTPNEQPVWIFLNSTIALFDRGVRFLYHNLIRPKKFDEDSRRKEFILNIILTGTVGLAVASNLSVLYGVFNDPSDSSGPMIFIPGLLFATFIGLLVLSRKGQVELASYILLSLYFLASTYLILYWGADLPQAILTYALVIIMSGILISSRFGVIATFCIIGSLLAISWLQVYEVITPLSYWKNGMFAMNDSIMVGITYLVVMLISWLYNHEIEKSLQRARQSEFELKHERDFLEIKVEERTRELQKMELQKIYELSQFAEFGRLALGFFHDLVNPLNTLLFNIIILKNTPGTRFSVINEAIDKSFEATKRMEEFMLKIKKQLQREQGQEIFFLENEIKEVILLLNYKIKEACVEVKFNNSESIQFYGSPLRFRQLVINLIGNAIESYLPVGGLKDQKKVIINLQRIGENIKLEVTDFGVGIPAANRSVIFKPFYTTKSSQQGIGIGLSTVKNIVENELGGHIEVKENSGSGSIFTVVWPQQYHPAALNTHGQDSNDT
jgi:signal transduction histidine kinase